MLHRWEFPFYHGIVDSTILHLSHEHQHSIPRCTTVHMHGTLCTPYNDMQQQEMRDTVVSVIDNIKRCTNIIAKN